MDQPPRLGQLRSASATEKKVNGEGTRPLMKHMLISEARVIESLIVNFKHRALNGFAGTPRTVR